MGHGEALSGKNFQVHVTRFSYNFCLYVPHEKCSVLRFARGIHVTTLVKEKWSRNNTSRHVHHNTYFHSFIKQIQNCTIYFTQILLWCIIHVENCRRGSHKTYLHYATGNGATTRGFLVFTATESASNFCRSFSFWLRRLRIPIFFVVYCVFSHESGMGTTLWFSLFIGSFQQPKLHFSTRNAPQYPTKW